MRCAGATVSCLRPEQGRASHDYDRALLLYDAPSTHRVTQQAPGEGPADEGGDAPSTAAEVASLRKQVAHLRAMLGLMRDVDGDGGALVPPQQAPAALARCRAQCWQLQRQVALMSAEIRVRTQSVGALLSSLVRDTSKQASVESNHRAACRGLALSRATRS